jgi:DNA-binding Lrp family transcriptional regulator
MITAYVMIIAKAGMEKSVVETLADLEAVKEVDVVYGDYDIIARLELDEVAELSDFIMTNIRPVEGVQRTSTLIIAAR